MLDIAIVLYKPGYLERRLIAELPRLTETPNVIRVFDNSENKKNFSMAWNDLANEGGNPFIAFLHSDIIPSQGWEKPLIQCLKEYPDVGAALANPARFDQIGRHFKLSDPPTAEEIEEWAAWSRAKMDGLLLPYAVGAGDCAVFFCVVVRRSDFQILKGFDERFRFVGNNHEFQWRLNDRNLKTVMVHASSVWHKDALSFRKAIEAGKFSEGREGAHWDFWKNMIQSGKAKKWHELSDVERASIRGDAAFEIGG